MFGKVYVVEKEGDAGVPQIDLWKSYLSSFGDVKCVSSEVMSDVTARLGVDCSGNRVDINRKEEGVVDVAVYLIMGRNVKVFSPLDDLDKRDYVIEVFSEVANFGELEEKLGLDKE